ncbi:YSIRK-type signal peptide-containing protein [Streptococcus thermophilus]|uniref:YSIRK-type signal peptide-containing protein n=1 Tax=Streptococcus thermophilus TaxID=1308 RepID=UPI0011082F38|nr:YSIRK-type signal peptide-containing protein [Streptococcus thermophilus]MBO1156706.1 YSIRK-type signal peptide-containing protein [Streptococcus thermophilus]MBO1161639.1 YSIRK-type signal peptide-containing protein [Streptococcus thermophilus]MCS9982864.1 YSIRK-type signal peptide-containing protein [Streptococcus thermophilus]MCS9985676.1 YSIRK-type signal peptide-containing protein [Streptococcus thermophilus]MCS9994704.1 YSIRK-type signal peptide-containing protein [Streptococcus therm
MGRRDLQCFSIRKYSFGDAYVLLGTTILVMEAVGVQHFKVSTSAVTDTPLSVSVLTDTAVNSSTVNHSEKQVVSVKEDGNITFPTSVVTTDIFEDAKASAIKKGVEVEETTFQSHTSLESTIADNHAQSKEINTVGYG